jgi:hypothetical protein
MIGATQTKAIAANTAIASSIGASSAKDSGGYNARAYRR